MGLYESNTEKSNAQYAETLSTPSSSESSITIWPTTSSIHNDISKTFNTILDSTPLNNIFGESWDETLANLQHLKSDNIINDIFQLNRSSQEDIDGLTGTTKYKTGMKAYPVPNTYSYKKCQDLQGLSVWDENGWWRCLFPRSVISGRGNGQNVDELSREDVESDKNNQFGLFFKDYSSLLKWRCHVRELVQRKLEEERRSRKESGNINDAYKEYIADSNVTPSRSGNDKVDQEKIISTSKSTNYHSLPNGDFQEITEINKVFANGDNRYEKYKKIYPHGGGEVVKIDLMDDKDILQQKKIEGSSSWESLIWGKSDGENKKD